MKSYQQWAEDASKSVDPKAKCIYQLGFEDGLKFTRKKIAAWVIEMGNFNGDTRYKLLAKLIEAIGNGDVDEQDNSLEG